jgi:hypothetical protein
VWLLNFAARVISRRVSERALVAAFQDIAPMIGVSLVTLDVTIWYYEKLAMATKDVPAMRIVAWQLLKQGLERELRQGSLKDFGWFVELDERERLYYDPAGLTMTAERSLFGEECQGETTVMLQQSGWSEGFQLSMRVRHETALPVHVYIKLHDRLTHQGWDVMNAPVFEARFDLDESMAIRPEMWVDGLGALVNSVVQAVEANLALMAPSDG